MVISIWLIVLWCLRCRAVVVDCVWWGLAGSWFLLIVLLYYVVLLLGWGLCYAYWFGMFIVIRL